MGVSRKAERAVVLEHPRQVIKKDLRAHYYKTGCQRKSPPQVEGITPGSTGGSLASLILIQMLRPHAQKF